MKTKLLIGMLVALLMVGCSGGSGVPVQIIPATYDASGTWDFEVTGYSNWCDGNLCVDLEDECKSSAQSIFQQLQNIQQINVSQDGNSFSIIFDSETYSGTVEGNVYKVSGEEQITINGVTGVAKWTDEMILENEDYFQGTSTYSISVVGYSFTCHITVNIRGWREGVHTPIIKIEPLSHDFGVVEYLSSSTMEVTITNAGHPLYADYLEISWPKVDNIDNFRFIPEYPVCWQIPKGESCKFKFIYEPITWDETHSTTISFDSNDPNIPTVSIDLVGEATDSLPVMDVSVEGECETPPDPYPGIYMCFEARLPCTGNSEPKTITFLNTGSIDLEIQSNPENSTCNLTLHTLDGELIHENHGQPWSTSLQPGESTSLYVVYHPSGSGAGYNHEGFNFTTNDPNNQMITVRAYGKGIYDPSNPDCWDEYCNN